MIITFDDVSYLLHFPTTRVLLDHSIISRPKALDLMVIHLGANPSKTQSDIEDTKGCHARFSFLSKNYINHLNAVVLVVCDDV